MTLRQSYNVDAVLRRQLAQPFTPFTRFHHPFLDPSLPEEDVSLVPPDLAPFGGLKWKLPQKSADAGQITGESSDALPDADDFLDRFCAEASNLHKDLSLLEGLVVAWAKIPTSVINANGKRRDDNRDTDYVTAAGSSVSAGGYDINEELSGPNIEMTSPSSNNSAANILQHHGTGTGIVEAQLEGHTQATKPERRGLNSKRSIGPYDLFWLKHDPYTQRRNGESVSPRNVAGTVEPLQTDE